MKKRLTLILCLLLAGIVNINAQKIKLFSSYEKNVDNGTRYVVVLSDNSIWWFMPGSAWTKSSTDGLPAGNIKHFSAYEKNESNGTRYVAVMDDNSIWWFIPNSTWKKSATDGLPAGYNIIQFQAYEKN